MFKHFNLSSSDLEDDVLEFTLAEIMEMESSFRGMKETTPSQEVCERLATKFSVSLHRSGKSAAKWDQVYKWFQARQRKEVAKSISSPLFLKDLIDSSKVEAGLIDSSKVEAAPVQNLPQKFRAKVKIPSYERRPVINPESFNKPKDRSVKEIQELHFEAKSSVDFAWYDVAAFLNFRVVYSGELEARVRFSGFGNSDDEWVKVKKSIRQRSIPLEGSECHKVEVGDLVLCYRETEDASIYCDAHIIDIERNKHDGEDCSCIFGVRYDSDCAEDKVHLNRICCRPR